jgi:hypothetical protein
MTKDHHMTYCITFYCRSAGSAPERALERVVADSGALGGVQLYATNQASGDGWAEASLGSTSEHAESGSLHLELHTAPTLVKKMIKQLSVEGEIRGIADADMAVILTLSGKSVDWAAVRAAWASMTELWRAVPYDDVSGFDVSIESLG